MAESSETLFDWLRASVPVADDGWYFAIFIEAVHLLLFVFFTVLYLVVARAKAFDKYRIRPAEPRDEKLTKNTIKEIGMSHLLSLPYIRFIMWPVFSWGSNITFTGALPSWQVIAMQIVGSMLIEDTVFYWIHRMMHHRWFYATIHKQHHQYKHTFSYAAEYSTPIEQTIANVIPSYAGPFFFNMHIGTLAIWLFIRIWETSDAHSGYVFPWSPWNMMLSVQGGTIRHDYHHSHNMGAYGSFFKFWDWAMGTDVHFNAYLKQHVNGQPDKDEVADKSQ